MADRAPDGMKDASPHEHLAYAHAHTISAGVHADLAAAHVAAAHDSFGDYAPIGESDSSDGSDGTDGGSGDGGDRSMPVVATPPQAGYAQNRTHFPAASGAARSYRAATRRR
jgi:hypothetical protein